MDVKVICADPATQFPLSAGNPNFAFGFVLPVNKCLAPDAAAIFYGVNSVARSGADDYRIGGRFGAITTISGNAGIADAAWPLGVILSVIVTNRFVQFLINNVPMGASNYTVGPYVETPLGYLVQAPGGLPPVGGKFRWSGGRARLREQLIPMILIKTVTTVSLLGATQGETPDTTVPVQP
jgi:hypothetical protein